MVFKNKMLNKIIILKFMLKFVSDSFIKCLIRFIKTEDSRTYNEQGHHFIVISGFILLYGGCHAGEAAQGFCGF